MKEKIKEKAATPAEDAEKDKSLARKKSKPHTADEVYGKTSNWLIGLLNFFIRKTYMIDHASFIKEAVDLGVGDAFENYYNGIDEGEEENRQSVILQKLQEIDVPDQGERKEEVKEPDRGNPKEEVRQKKKLASMKYVLVKLWEATETAREVAEEARANAEQDRSDVEAEPRREKKSLFGRWEEKLIARAYFRKGVEVLISRVLTECAIPYSSNPYTKCIDELYWLAEKLKTDSTGESTRVLNTPKADKTFQSLIEILFPKPGATLRAKSLMASCGSFKEEKKRLIEFSKRAKREFVFFISAISRKGDKEYSTEYHVAKKLTEAFRARGIKYFWWEDAAETKLSKKGKTIGEKLRPSTKIAAGLAFSSAFIGLAFDGAEEVREEAGKYEFPCFDNENFKYEADVFLSLMGGGLDGNEIEKTKPAREFTREIVSEQNFKKYVPQTRWFTFFTYGAPLHYEKYACFDNQNENRLNQVALKKGEDDVIVLAQQVYDKIVDLIANNEKLRKLCGIKMQVPAKIMGSLRYVFSEQRESEKEDAAVRELYLPYKPCKRDDKTTLATRKIDVPEDIDSIPSDYFFEYAVTDEYGNSAKEHFTFFPESYYDKNGELKWRVKAVIKDWNYAFVELYKSTEAVASAAPVALDEQKRAELEKKYPLIAFRSAFSYLLNRDEAVDRVDYEKYTSKSNNNHCAICIGSESLFGSAWNGIVGRIEMSTAPLNDGADPPKGDKIYYFNVVFAPKKIVHYSIEKSRDGAHSVFRINSDISNIKNIRVRVTSHGKRLARFSSDSGVFVGSVGQLMAKQREGQFSSGQNYSLRPCDGFEKYYIFLDDTIYAERTGAGRRDRAEKAVPERLKRCPFCGRYLTSDKKLSEHADYCYPIVAKKIGGRYYCQHNFVHQYWNASESEASKLIGEIEDLSSVQLKDENRLLLPSAIKKNKVVIVSVVGVTQSGKSTFLSSLFRTGAEIPDLQQIGNKLYPYVGNATFFGLKSKVVTSNSTNEVNGGLSKKMLASYYNVRPYRGFVSKTSNDPKKNPIIAQIPYVVQLDRIQGTSSGAYLSFFDAPGGVFLAGDGSQVMQGNSDPTMILRSDCIILLINATPQNGEDGGIGLGDAQSILNAIIKRREDAGNARRKDAENASSDIPLAIVLCKFDEFASKFDSNSYVRMQSPIATGNKYGGSRMQTYIDRCSDEVEAFICTAKDSGAFMECLEGFPNRKFFAVSSIGRNDSIVCDDNGPEYRTVYYSEPKHVEHVLLWLMYKTGAIV